MGHTFKQVVGWLYARAENLLAAMLCVMFISFLLQIIFRYVLNLSVGWTHEVSVIMWLWIVLFGSAFVLRESEEVRFDIIYAGLRGNTKRIFRIITAAVVIIIFGISLPAVVDYVTFMRVEETSYLDIRLDYLYSIYVIFVVAMICRYLSRAWKAVYGPVEEQTQGEV